MTRHWSVLVHRYAGFNYLGCLSLATMRFVPQRIPVSTGGNGFSAAADPRPARTGITKTGFYPLDGAWSAPESIVMIT